MNIDSQKPYLISRWQAGVEQFLGQKRNKREGRRLWGKITFGAATTSLLAACEGNAPKAKPSPPEVAPYPSPAAIVRDPETRFEIVSADEIKYTEQVIKNFVRADYVGSEKEMTQIGEFEETHVTLSFKEWVSRGIRKISWSSREIDNGGNSDLGDAVFSSGAQKFKLKDYKLYLYGNTYDLSFRGDTGKDPTLVQVKKMINIPDSVNWKQYKPDTKGDVITGWIHGLSKGADGSISIISINNSGEVEYKYLSASNPWIKDFEDTFNKVEVPKLPPKVEIGEITDAKNTLSILKATFVEGGTDKRNDSKTKELRYSRNFDTLDGWIGATNK